MRRASGLWLPGGEPRPIRGAGDWSLRGGGGQWSTEGEDLTNSDGVAVTCNNNAKPATYTTIIDPTPLDAQGVIFHIFNQSELAPNDTLVDLAVGASGSEQDIATNLFMPRRAHVAPAGSKSSYYLPISIPKGSRLSTRGQSALGNDVDCFVQLVQQTFLPSQPLSRVTTYGAATGDSGGTQYDTGASANTKNGWTQIDASIANDIREIIVTIGARGNQTAGGSVSTLIELGVGAGSSELQVFGEFPTISSTIEARTLEPLGPVPCWIPKGSRLSVQAQSTTTDTTDRTFDIVVYGID